LSQTSITDPLELVTAAIVVVNTVDDDDDDWDDEVNEDDDGVFVEKDDSNEGQAITTPSDVDDQAKSATEHSDELNVGEEPKNNANPSPSVELLLLEELDEEENET